VTEQTALFDEQCITGMCRHTNRNHYEAIGSIVKTLFQTNKVYFKRTHAEIDRQRERKFRRGLIYAHDIMVLDYGVDVE